MTERLTQYRGALSAEEAAKGISLARGNATRLIQDAEVLLQAERYPSAIALATLAIEELGKVQIIKIIVLQTDDSALKKAWKEYRSHRAKNVQWILPSLAGQGARTLEQVRSAADIHGEHTMMLDTIKQLALYTDCFGAAGRWSDPAEAVDPKFAEAILGVAKVLNREETTSKRELELWVEMVGPHYQKPGMVEALLRWQQTMFDEGLSKRTAAEMEAFVRGQPIEMRPR